MDMDCGIYGDISSDTDYTKLITTPLTCRVVICCRKGSVQWGARERLAQMFIAANTIVRLIKKHNYSMKMYAISYYKNKFHKMFTYLNFCKICIFQLNYRFYT